MNSKVMSYLWQTFKFYNKCMYYRIYRIVPYDLQDLQCNECNVYVQAVGQTVYSTVYNIL